MQLDDGHAVRLVHPHTHQARPRFARRARPERAHHHEGAVGGGGGQLGVAAGQERWRQAGQAGAEPLRLGARSSRRADVVEPRVSSGVGSGGGGETDICDEDVALIINRMKESAETGAQVNTAVNMEALQNITVWDNMFE